MITTYEIDLYCRNEEKKNKKKKRGEYFLIYEHVKNKFKLWTIASL